jgi:hypothetical protein
MLDEKAIRQPHFLEGTPILLADGQYWTFPAPAGRHAEAGRGTETGLSSGFAAEYISCMKAVAEAGDPAECRRAELALAIALLARNYRLAPEDYRRLLGLPSGSTELEDMQAGFRSLSGRHLRALSRQEEFESSSLAEHNYRSSGEERSVGIPDIL